ncbi:unnamed protein product [Trichobilharzia regenti]|nr:unnamed protein product [Trichobilharzia regenti]
MPLVAQRRSKGDLAITSLLRGAIDNHTSHPTVVRQCYMPSNPHRETYGIARSEDGEGFRQRRSRGDLAITSLLRGAIDNHTSHSTVVRQFCMTSNPHRETYGIARSEDGGEARLSTIANDFPDCSRLDNATDNEQ